MLKVEEQASQGMKVLEEPVPRSVIRQLVVPTAWTIQGFGLVLVTFLSFIPRLHHLQEYLFFTLLLVAVGVAWLEGRPAWIRTPMDLPLFLFVGWVLLTIPFATDPAYSFAEWRKLVAHVLVFYWALMVVCVRNDRATRHRILATVTVGTLALSVYGLIDFVWQGGSWKGRGIRAGAPSSNSIVLSTYLVIALPLLAAAAASMPIRWMRAGCGGVFGLAALTQIVTYTRGGWVGSIAEGIAFGLLSGSRRLMMGILGGGLAFGVGLLFLSLFGYQQGVTSTHSLIERVAVWQLGIQEVMAHPLLGVGYGDYTFRMRFGGYVEAELATGLHNTFLMVAMGSGVPALMFLVAVLARAVWQLLQYSRHLSDRTVYAFVIAIAIMIVGFAVRNLFEYMFAGSLANLFWILVATGVAQTIPKTMPSVIPNRDRP